MGYYCHDFGTLPLLNRQHISAYLLASGYSRIKMRIADLISKFHEAVMQMESGEVDPGAIVEVAQTGYRLGDLVLRPSRVVVAR